MESATLLVFCPDRRGLVATITDFIFRRNGNILHLDQHVDTEHNVFFMRVQWDLAGFEIPKDKITAAFTPLGEQYGMTWRVNFSDEIQRMALFVSKEDHCLYDLLSRWQSGDLRVHIPLIISNHPTLGHVAEKFNIPFHLFTITKDNKAEQEQAQIDLLKANAIELVVLARYMQIITADFIAQFPNRIINIHHSFLPAFPGAKPYHQASERGVKIIGATSHYVTPDLDAGPIIEQDVTRVDHRDSVSEMIRKGKDLEKTVLARAIWAHLGHRVLVYNNKTVVFK
ncbi:MAG TPA: formyltetrahydrofolate deformylase [Aggregatilineales bacterium]|nr:formyltetrahydrofolate deformylase [Aggregatilineales bacterium]